MIAENNGNKAFSGLVLIPWAEKGCVVIRS